MILMKTEPVELRGASRRITKSGTQYALLNVENPEGKPFQLYVRELSALSEDLKKGDKVMLSVQYSVFDRSERINVVAIEKVK